jgi:CysZ protein
LAPPQDAQTVEWRIYVLLAYLKAIAQLDDQAFQRILWKSLLAASIVFALLWFGIARLFADTVTVGDGILGWAEWLGDLLGFLFVPLLAWLLFPATVNLVIGWLLGDVADAVDARHYAGLAKANPASAIYTVISSLRLLGKMLVLNLLALPFLLIPVVFPFVFYSVNGYLLGWEYFELVALRRITPDNIDHLRRAHRGQVFLAGVVAAVLLTIPVINLLTPVLTVAAMVHLVETWRNKSQGDELQD